MHVGVSRVGSYTNLLHTGHVRQTHNANNGPSGLTNHVAICGKTTRRHFKYNAHVEQVVGFSCSSRGPEMIMHPTRNTLRSLCLTQANIFGEEKCF